MVMGVCVNRSNDSFYQEFRSGKGVALSEGSSPMHNCESITGPLHEPEKSLLSCNSLY